MVVPRSVLGIYLTLVRLLLVFRQSHYRVGNLHLSLVDFVGDAMVRERQETVARGGLVEFPRKLLTTGWVVELGKVEVHEFDIVHCCRS